MKRIKLGQIYTGLHKTFEAKKTEKDGQKVVDIVVGADNKEINYNNYQTKHFHMCPKAKSMFSSLHDVAGDNLAEITAAVKKADQMFGYEMKFQEAETITPSAFNRFVQCALDLRGMIGKISQLVGRELHGRTTFVAEHLKSVMDVYIDKQGN